MRCSKYTSPSVTYLPGIPVWDMQPALLDLEVIILE